jgi:hypothetical protein
MIVVVQPGRPTRRCSRPLESAAAERQNRYILKMEIIMRKIIAVGLFLLIILPFFFVQKINATSPEKRTDIIKLLKITGTAGIASKMGVYASNQIIDVWQKSKKELTPRAIEIIKEEMTAVINEQVADEESFFSYFIPIYDKYYTHSEIKGLVSFWESELGRKSIQVMPSLMNEGMVAGEKWGQSIKPIAVERIIKKFEAEGIKPQE